MEEEDRSGLGRMVMVPDGVQQIFKSSLDMWRKFFPVDGLIGVISRVRVQNTFWVFGRYCGWLHQVQRSCSILSETSLSHTPSVASWFHFGIASSQSSWEDSGSLPNVNCLSCCGVGSLPSAQQGRTQHVMSALVNRFRSSGIKHAQSSCNFRKYICRISECVSDVEV